jgi:hypothetical protein
MADRQAPPDPPGEDQSASKSTNWPIYAQGMAAIATGIAAIAALIIASITAYYTGSGFRDSHQQLLLNEQDQLTDWYSAAVTDLGSVSTGVRVGGIYLLRKVMLTDPSEQPVIVNILTAFIRANDPKPKPNNIDEELASLRGLPDSRPEADIQAALTVLAERNPVHDGGAVIDLNLTNLEGANLPNEGYWKLPTAELWQI